MQYNSWLYVIAFLGCTVLLYYVFPLRLRWNVLLGASVAFYLFASRQLILVTLLSAGIIYYGALEIDRGEKRYQQQKAALSKEEKKQLKERMKLRNRHVLTASLAAAFGILFFFKYFNFVSANLDLLFRTLHLPVEIPLLNLLMPLGISFYTLSAVSYLVDVYRGVCEAQRNFAKLLLFLLFFPVITEGPISRYGQLGPQLVEGHAFDYRKFCFGTQTILWGLFKSVVMADRLAAVVRNIFSTYSSHSGSVVIMTVMLYTLQIYMDFSGGIDIARGSAELFGITLAPNFARPFFAASVNDFWRRWHISLGSWLRDYIFYPISLSRPFQALSRKSRNRLNSYYAATIPALFALLAVWLGNGIWHGAAWKYICYGLYYYVIMALGMLFEPLFVRLFELLHINRKGMICHVLQVCRTFILVNIGMLIFRADSLKTAWSMFCSMFRSNMEGSALAVFNEQGLPYQQLKIILWGVAIVLVVSILQERGIGIRELIGRRTLPVRWAIYIAAILVVVIAGAYGPGFGVVDFIYAQF
ncbi:MAG: MBOAT family O-acyltransferase [Clostridiaceae bacterium]|nr:MBOAT family O-acyltransferase [Clostridiaceae bacterium]